MTSPAKRSTPPAIPSGDTPPVSSTTPSPSPPAESNETNTALLTQRQVPIPPPSHHRQYRAIGLVRGIFLSSQEKITQGALVTDQGKAIDTVLLGRMISLVKNHLDLSQPHLWVVYPRTHQEDDKLHLQICGVWEPETLQQNKVKESEEAEKEITPVAFEDGYFSIRGEVIFYSLEKEVVIIKIRQSPKKQGERPKFFKLKLKGTLSDRPLRNFWDIQVQLQGETLTIVSGTNLGAASKRKPFNKKGKGKKPWSKKPRQNSDDSTASSQKPVTRSRPASNRPVKKTEN